MAPAPVPAPAPQALPTFNVVLPTVGRASLRRMLSSLQTQLLPADCLTVIFDGGDAAVVAAFQSQLNSFLCRVDLIVEPQRLGAWGHNARTKHAPSLTRRDFVVHADDDDYYAPGAFDVLRLLCVDRAVLYLTHYYDVRLRRFVPDLFDHEVRVGNISTQCGIIPYDVNGKAVWAPVHGGDGMFYRALFELGVPFHLLVGVVTYVYNPPEEKPPKRCPQTGSGAPCGGGDSPASATVVALACVLAVVAAGAIVATVLAVLYASRAKAGAAVPRSVR